MSNTTKPDEKQVSHNPRNNHKPLREATRKEKAFAQYLVDNPTATLSEAYQAVYNVRPETTVSSVHSQASALAKRPTVKLELSRYSEEAESVLVEVLEYSNRYGKEGGHVGAAYAVNARQTAQDILDRVHGKATQRTEVRSEAVILNIDLTTSTTTSVAGEHVTSVDESDETAEN